MSDCAQAEKNMEAAYQRAARFRQATSDINNVARNTTLLPHWIGDTQTFWYRRYTSAGVEFRLVNSETRSNELAFDHSALAEALTAVAGQKCSADNLPIFQVEIVPSPHKIYFNAFNQHYCFDAGTNQCQVIAPPLDVHSRDRLLSPDGKKVAFARNYNLWVQDVESGRETALTEDGEQYYAYAASPILWGFPLNNDLQARWSPDSLTLFTVQTDNRKVIRTPVIDYVPKGGSVRPTVAEYPCGYPGDEHVEEQRILAINVETGRQQNAHYRPIPANRSAYGLFTDNLGWWSTNNQFAYFVDMERGDQLAHVVEFDTYTGATRILFDETSKTYLNLSPSEITTATALPLPNSHELIWFSERDDWAHLYLYDLTTGNLKNQITSGNWMVRELLHFDAKRRELFIQTGGRVVGRDPYLLDICRVNIDTGEITPLTSSDHEYTVIGSLGMRNTISLFSEYSTPDRFSSVSGVAPDSSCIVVTRSRADQAPISQLLDRDGAVIMVLDEAELVGLPDNWQWPEPIKLLAADGETDIYGVIFRPSNFAPDKQYPVIDCSSCDAELAAVPKGSFTNATMGGLWYLDAAAMAELGFIVVAIDGRGTGQRNRSFVDTSYGWVPSANDAQDRIAGINQMAERYPYIDTDRVGIVGFNGNVSAVYSLLQHPEFYKVGVSHALQDTRLMTTAWGEMYEGTEQSKRHPYAEDLVANLKGKLLLMHGLLDRMDHPSATFRLVDALQNANKDFDMLILPNEGVNTHIGSDYAFRRTWDFFVKHLQQVEPPKEFKIGEGSV